MGGGILQNTVVNGKGPSEYVEFQGTSMATPHVSGAAAVLLSTGVPPQTVSQVLMRTARGSGFNERLGNGTLDLKRAVQAVGIHANAAQFTYAFLFTYLLCFFANTQWNRTFAVALGAALLSGGLFFLDWTPFAGSILSQGVMRWPAEWVGVRWGFNPLWVSAGILFLATFILGVSPLGRMIAFSLCVGFGTSMLYGWITGVVVPSFMPTSFATVWIGANVSICLLLSLALLGMNQLDRSSG